MPPRVESTRDAEALADEVIGGNRTALGQAITLVESVRTADEPLAKALLARVNPHSGGAHRVAISGAPGAGKSTLIESLGLDLVDRGKRVAVLAIDPSSAIPGASILGDKSRMERLAREQAAFIRPSPSAATLGGVARRTRESMRLVEAAGYDVVLVETIGVGPCETAARAMVDTVVVLLLPGGGDELQGIKKGILEVGDLLVVNKADGDRVALARQAVRDHSAALRYLRSADESGWTPRTLAISAQTGAGLDELWTAIQEHRSRLEASAVLQSRRHAQAASWMWSLIEDRLWRRFNDHPAVAAQLKLELERLSRGGGDPSEAADALLAAFGLAEM